MKADDEVDLALAGLSEAEGARVLLVGRFDERNKASVCEDNGSPIKASILLRSDPRR